MQSMYCCVAHWVPAGVSIERRKGGITHPSQGHRLLHRNPNFRVTQVIPLGSVKWPSLWSFSPFCLVP